MIMPQDNKFQEIIIINSDGVVSVSNDFGLGLESLVSRLCAWVICLSLAKSSGF